MILQKNSQQNYSRLDWIKLAQLSKTISNFQRMQYAITKIIECIIKQQSYLHQNEQQLLSYTFKKKIDFLKISHRLICQAEQNKSIINKFVAIQKLQIEKQGINFCLYVIEMIDKILQILSKQVVSKSAQFILEKSYKADQLQALIFYYKIKGDYNRYILDFIKNEKQNKQIRAKYINQCRSVYKYATSQAIKHKLDFKNAIRLGLALNFSLFFYQIDQDPATACQLAIQAIENAKKDKTRKANKKQSNILQRLNDNVSLWTSDQCQYWEQSQS